VRQIYHQCKLVHADLSEYNILFHEDHLWIIDVSQSVEHDHPSAFDFLRNDLKNVEDFFGKLGASALLGLRRSFEYVTTEKLDVKDDEGNDEAVLRRWLQEEEVKGNTPGQLNEGQASTMNNKSSAHEDAVFLQSYIPRTLNEVYDPERDVELLARGEGKRLIYADTIGLVDQQEQVKSSRGVRFDQSTKDEKSSVDNVSHTPTSTRNTNTVSSSDEEDDSEGDEVSESEDEDLEPTQKPTGEEPWERKPRGHRHEDREAKKVGGVVI